MTRWDSSEMGNFISKQNNGEENSLSSIASTSTEAITFIDLNDDCLNEVFKNLDLSDLCSVADSCSRLKSATQAYFAYSELRTLHFPYSGMRYSRKPLMVNQLIYESSRVLRNFGASVISFIETEDLPYDRLVTESLRKYQRNIIELLIQYCGENLIELKLCHFNMTNEIAIIMRPLLGHLQKFELHWVSHLRMLSAWCPELRELHLRDTVVNQKGWNQRFQKLTKMAYFGCDMDGIKEFVRRNPQLKSFEIGGYNVETPIFQIVGEHATEIENLIVGVGLLGSEYPVRAGYFDRLRNLNSVTITDDRSQHFLTAAINDIAAADISLKKLCGKASREVLKVDQLVEGISKLKTLETLELKVVGLRTRDVIHICKQLSKLSKLRIRISGELTIEYLLYLIRIAENLQWLFVSIIKCNKTNCIDASAYKELLQIVEKRAFGKRHLEIILPGNCYSRNIPGELAKTHKNSLSIVLR